MSEEKMNFTIVYAEEIFRRAEKKKEKSPKDWRSYATRVTHPKNRRKKQ